MSGAGPSLTAAVLNPAPERWGAFRAGNLDSRSRDTTGDLEPISDTVITASVSSIVRCDGNPMTSQDLSWTGAFSLDATARVISIMLASGTNILNLARNNPIDYVVTITAQTNGGRTLSWDTYQLVVAQIG